MSARVLFCLVVDEVLICCYRAVRRRVPIIRCDFSRSAVCNGSPVLFLRKPRYSTGIGASSAHPIPGISAIHRGFNFLVNVRLNSSIPIRVTPSGPARHLFVRSSVARKASVLSVSSDRRRHRLALLMFRRANLRSAPDTLQKMSAGHSKRLRNAALGDVLSHGFTRARHVPRSQAPLPRPHRR